MIYDEFEKQGLEILGFPCNQFGKQEPGTPETIQAYVDKKYGSRFPLFKKCEVNGKKAHELYRYLIYNSSLHDRETSEIKDIPWNFAKFLVSADGKEIKYFDSRIDPKKIIPDIEKYCS